MPVDIFMCGRMGKQHIQDGAALRFAETDDANGRRFMDKQSLATGFRMDTHDRLGNWRSAALHFRDYVLVAAGDIDAWTVALTRALATPMDTRARMGEAARVRATRLYSLPAMYAATFEVYRQVLEAVA